MFKRVFFTLLAVLVFFTISSQKSYAGSCTPVFPATTCSTSDGVNITATVPETTVTFSGFAPISSIVYIKEGDYIVGSVVTASSGVFNKTVISTPGIHTYSIYLIDSLGRTTPETGLAPVTLSSQIDVPINNINLPPTISVTKTKITQGQLVSVFGQGSPGATVDIYVNNVKKFSYLVGSDSTWIFDLNGGNLADQNSFYAISNRPNINPSIKSQVVNLDVLACSDESCNRNSPKSPTSTSSATPAPSKKPGSVTYNFKLEIGANLRNLIITSSIFISIILLLLPFIFFIIRRRRRKKKVLEDLEKNVEKDLQTQAPLENIRSDFEKAEEEIE